MKPGKIFDQLRRKTVEALDKIEVEDPNIADLEDPTLDQFLAGLEREPDIEAQLGLRIVLGICESFRTCCMVAEWPVDAAGLQ